MEWKERGRLKKEGTYVYLWLIHVDVWQKPTQYCNYPSINKKSKKKKKKEHCPPRSDFTSTYWMPSWTLAVAIQLVSELQPHLLNLFSNSQPV